LDIIATREKKPLSSKRQVKKQQSGLMDEQMYLFAEAYYHASGKQKRYRTAAIAAGASEGSAATLGMEWARLPQVLAYWKALDDSTGLARRALHMRALERQEEFAMDEEFSKADRIGINDKIINHTKSAFDVAEGSGSDEDSATQRTMLQLLQSMQVAFGGEDDDNQN
jgi:hypothetical protein